VFYVALGAFNIVLLLLKHELAFFFSSCRKINCSSSTYRNCTATPEKPVELGSVLRELHGALESNHMSDSLVVVPCDSDLLIT
jgi:hypothetical protein